MFSASPLFSASATISPANTVAPRRPRTALAETWFGAVETVGDGGARAQRTQGVDSSAPIMRSASAINSVMRGLNS